MFITSLFSKSYLSFKLPDGQDTEVVAVLDPVEAKTSLKSDYDRTNQPREYEGFVVSISQGTIADLPPGLVGTGEVNGEQHRVRLEYFSTDSVAIATKQFGSTIRITLVDKAVYGSSS